MMRDDKDERLDRLFAAARNEQVTSLGADDFFESRLMARIKELHEAAADPWYAPAWRMLPAFTAAAALITVCTITFNPPQSGDIFAAITIGQDENAGISLLTGE
jgi:hypothetical protein